MGIQISWKGQLFLKESACVAAYRTHVREQVVILGNDHVNADNVYQIKQSEEHLCAVLVL